MSFQASVNIFGISISLAIILYIFLAIGVLTFILYLLSLLFGKNKFKDVNLQDEELLKRQTLEQNKENLDREVISIVKNRKGRDK